jgi:hypothetical protein
MEFNLGVEGGGGLESRFSSIQSELHSFKEALSRLENRLNELQGEVGRKLAEQSEAAPAGSGSHSSTGQGAQVLKESVDRIAESQSQVDVLNQLISGLARYVKRVALFVVSGEQATGWLARGFGVTGDMPKERRRIVIPLKGEHLIYRVAMDRAPWRGSPFELTGNASLLQMMGRITPNEVVAFPLLVKGKVAAVLYLDQGDSFQPIPSSGKLEVLVKFASLVAELLPLRRRTTGAAKRAEIQGKLRLTASPARKAEEPFFPPPAPPEPREPAFPPPVSEAPRFTPAHEAPPRPPAFSPFAEPPKAPPFPPPSQAGPPSAPSFVSPLEKQVGMPKPQPSLPPDLSPEERKFHEDARRLARLLVSEIKLYNEAEVALGRRNRDLYHRLREDVERSLQVFNERVSESIRRTKDYFKEEMIRILAGGDPSLLGI